jgi:hypothetical protein
MKKVFIGLAIGMQTVVLPSSMAAEAVVNASRLTITQPDNNAGLNIVNMAPHQALLRYQSISKAAERRRKGFISMRQKVAPLASWSMSRTTRTECLLSTPMERPRLNRMSNSWTEMPALLLKIGQKEQNIAYLWIMGS